MLKLEGSVCALPSSPYLTWPPVLVIISAVLAPIGISVFMPTAWILAAPGER